MAIHVALNHRTSYQYGRPVTPDPGAIEVNLHLLAGATDIVVACGRDYADVSPTRSAFTGIFPPS
jgi:hypothetical protein